jgi:hypothetical protein
MSKETVYWKQRNGKSISIDDMDLNHLRNAFKLLIKHYTKTIIQANEIVDKYNTLIRKRKAEKGSASFNLNGDAANMFNHDMQNYVDECDATECDIY